MFAAVYLELSSYLSAPTAVFEAEDDFPSTQHLSGEYYIVGECY